MKKHFMYVWEQFKPLQRLGFVLPKSVKFVRPSNVFAGADWSKVSRGTFGVRREKISPHAGRLAIR